MSVKVGEYGKEIWVASGGYDLSSNTELTLNFTAPSGGTSFSANTSSGVAIGAGGTDPDTGDVLDANEYVVYTIPNPSLFDVAGTWQVCLIYLDASNKHMGDDSDLTVGEACT